MSLVYGRDDEVAAWAGKKIGTAGMGRLGLPFVRPFTAIGIERAGELVGAMVFNNYTGPDIELTVASDVGIPRKAIRAAARYVFEQLGCIRVTMTARAWEPRHQLIALRLGFDIEGLSPDKFGPGRDGVILGLRKANCRWM